MKTCSRNLPGMTRRWTYVLGIMLTVALLIPVTVVAQSTTVNLGTAGNFVVLAKTGISTTGVTAITGNIGISPAAASFMTGFALTMDVSNTFSTSSLITGKAYAADYTSPTPTTMTTAIGDMQTAYTDAAGRVTPDSLNMGAGDITGKTITHGLYKWGTSLLISAGGLTISGNATDIWIFQVAGDLTVANGAIVTLGGGAKSSNIFWQVAGSVIIGTTAQMKGILLCQTQIAFSTGATLNGRALAQTAVTMDANTLVQPTTSTAVQNHDMVPATYELSQNYPNPFNPSTRIDYSLAEAGMVSLKVYNVLGYEVATIVNGRQEAGSYSVPFGVDRGTFGLASGVYFYRLETGSFVSTKKLILMK